VEDDAAAVVELARVVRPGGSILLNLPAHPWLASAHDKITHSARRYTKARVREIAAEARLDVVRLGYWNSTLFPALALWPPAPPALWRLARRRGAGEPGVWAPAPFVIPPLATLLRGEAFLSPRLPLPPGLSLFAVLRRPAEITSGPPVARPHGRDSSGILSR